MLKHYYHIYCDGLWIPAVTQHLQALCRSDLWDELDGNFFVGLVGSQRNREDAKDFLHHAVEKFTIVVEKEQGWEQETLDKLYEDCLESDPFKVLYCHTKGAGRPFKTQDRWRKIMTQVNVDGWREAVQLLDSYDAVGALFLRDGEGSSRGGEHLGVPGFFAGTFWWANSEYIKVLEYPKRKNRWDAEHWVGQSGRVVDEDDEGGITVRYNPATEDNLKIYDMYQRTPNLFFTRAQLLVLLSSRPWSWTGRGHGGDGRARQGSGLSGGRLVSQVRDSNTSVG